MTPKQIASLCENCFDRSESGEGWAGCNRVAGFFFGRFPEVPVDGVDLFV
jgi:hypothetical protein